LDETTGRGGWAFEGSPVTDGSCLYVALRRRDAARVEAHVACFDASSGRLRWRRPVCTAEIVDTSRTYDVTHQLLTLDQGTLYYNTNLGAIAALRTCDGEFQWLTTYPRIPLQRTDPDRNELHRYRDLTPCLVSGDTVYAAPRDSPAVFALDAITGHVLWTNHSAVDAIHLLGVAEDRLVLSGDCLYWLDAKDGSWRGQFPPGTKAVPGHARPAPRGWGRGVLGGANVYWPTRDTIYVFRQRTVACQNRWEPTLVRRIPLKPFGARGGNLVMAQDVLLVASADRLLAFNETGRPEHARGP
jgi:outer membrane protein assembly factor BamB